MRARGQAGRVEKRGSNWYGHYYVYIWLADGTEKRHHTGLVLGKCSEMTKQVAKDKLRAHILSTTGTTEAKHDDAVTLEWFVENRFLPMKVGGWRPATERGNRIDLRCYILPALGAVRLKDLDTFRCQQAIYSLAKRGLSEPVILRCRTLLKAICEMALDMDFLHKNPAKKVSMPDCKVTPKPTLSKNTLRTLLQAITDPRDHLILMLGVFCAVRPSELFGLTWDSYQGDKLVITSTAWRGRLYEGKTKNRASRAPVYLPAVIRYEIERWKRLSKSIPNGEIAEQNKALMFPTANGRPLEARHFMRDFVRPTLKRIGVTQAVTFQILRRSAATRNQQHGTMKDVQELLRHSSIETTANVYMQAIPESVKQMIEMDVADVMAIEAVTVQ